MIGSNQHDSQLPRETINVVKLGPLDTGGVEQTLYRANEIQQAFHFKADFYKNNLRSLGGRRTSAPKNTKIQTLSRPMIVLSSALLGDHDHGDDADQKHVEPAMIYTHV
jgi:hypothetical protein